MPTASLFPHQVCSRIEFARGAWLLTGFASRLDELLLGEISRLAESAPFRHMLTPGGRPMSVAMTNCGRIGWVSSRAGYRYDPVDPETGRQWPAMPPLLSNLAADAALAAGFDAFQPDVCLINRYATGSRLTLHQDRNERDFTAPIVSVSLGVPARFLFGGLKRTARTQRIWLSSGDVAVWGGPARLCFHGIEPLPAASHPLTGSFRFNLTFRRAA